MLFLWIWGVVGLLFGFLVFIGTGALLGPMLPTSWRQRLGGWYNRQAMMMLDRAVLARRKHGGWDIYASDYDGDQQAEKTKMNGKTRHFEDPNNLVSSLGKRTFGIVDERFNVFVSPMLADVARRGHEWTNAGRHRLVNKDDATDTVAFARYMPMDVTPKNVDVGTIYRMLSGSASPDITETAKEYTKISQEGFKKRDAIMMGAVTINFAIGFGMVAGAYYLGLPDSSGGSSISLMALPLLEVML